MSSTFQVSSSTSVLEFAGVTMDAQPPYDAGIADVSLSLPAGGLLLAAVDPTRPHTPLADLAQGLIAPSAGTVRHLGEDWQRVSADRAVALRGRMGRTFENGGWINNLDVDENITLPQRYHTSRDPEEILKEALTLAIDLGLPEIPAGRPAAVSRFLLRRAQWVRALLGHPALILLERPGDELPADWIAPLVKRIASERNAGAAVVWITSEPQREALSELNPTLQIDLRDGNMQDRDTRCEMRDLSSDPQPPPPIP
jgi:phospholipid/cholesterol/gamma-HCH transport system ATP-binding protein